MPSDARLQREVLAIAIDPLSRAEIRQVRLPAGTVIHDSEKALKQAAEAAEISVTVRVSYPDGCVGMKRIDAVALVQALAPLVPPVTS